MNTHFSPSWSLADIVEQTLNFKRSQGRWPNTVTRQGERSTFSSFLIECRQTGATHDATPMSVALIGLNPGSHSVADVARAIEEAMRAGDVRSYRQSKEDVAATFEPLLKSAAVRGAVGPSIVIAGRQFALSDYLSLHEDNADHLPYHLASVLDVAPPCSVGRAVQFIRNHLRGGV